MTLLSANASTNDALTYQFIADDVLAYRINDFCKAVGLGRSTIYLLIKEGKLKTVTVGGRRLIPKASALALLQAAA